MGTAEILIVFSALMALIALVTIGIDWLGKPLKNRRFIPRMYRFDDEKLPVDAYGNTTLTEPQSEPEPVPFVPAFLAPTPPVHAPNYGPPMALPPHPGPPHTGPPLVDPAIVPSTPGLAEPNDATDVEELAASAELVPEPTPEVAPAAAKRTQPAPRQVAELAPEVAARRSAFSDTIASDESAENPVVDGFTTTDTPRWSAISSKTAGPPIEVSEVRPRSWTVGMALDATVNDTKPNLADKAERFWQTVGESMADSHFDDADLARMKAGKAPKRPNPRTGKDETMALTGLREASSTEEVRMRWPDESVDPWSAR